MWDEYFFEYAMHFFERAGYAPSKEPSYKNHSSKQALYIDAEKSVVLSNYQRTLLNEFGNVSRLFELGDDLFDAGEYQSIAVYSLTLFDTYCIKQTVCDIHVLIQATIEAEASLILSKCGELMILSCAARGEKCMMSKWYPIDDDFEQLAMKLDPANICFRSAADFFLDIIYCAAPYLYFSEPVEGVDDHLDYDDIVDNVIVDDVTENDDTAVEMDLFDGTFDNDVPDEKILSDPLLIVKWLQTH